MRIVLGTLAALLLAGCDAIGSPSDGGTENTAEKDALPEGIALPPDTKIASRSEISNEAGEGSVILLDSTAKPEELEAHFQAQAEAAGFEISVTTNSAGLRQLVGRREDGMQFDFAATADADGTTRASLAIGRERQR